MSSVGRLCTSNASALISMDTRSNTPDRCAGAHCMLRNCATPETWLHLAATMRRTEGTMSMKHFWMSVLAAGCVAPDGAIERVQINQGNDLGVTTVEIETRDAAF